MPELPVGEMPQMPEGDFGGRGGQMHQGGFGGRRQGNGFGGQRGNGSIQY